MKPPVGFGLDDVAELLQEARLAVGRQAHHLAFIAVFGEAEILAGGGVHDADRVRILDLAQNVDAVPFPKAPHGADEVAEAVDGEDRSLVEAGDQEAARHVRLVVLHVVELGAEGIGGNVEGARQLLAQVAHLGGVGQPGGDHARQAGEPRDREQDLLVQVRRGIARNADVVEFGSGYAGGLEAVADGQGGKARAMLLAIEPFLFCGGHQLAIVHDRRRCVPVVSINSQDVQTHSLLAGRNKLLKLTFSKS